MNAFGVTLVLYLHLLARLIISLLGKGRFKQFYCSLVYINLDIFCFLVLLYRLLLFFFYKMLKGYFYAVEMVVCFFSNY